VIFYTPFAFDAPLEGCYRSITVTFGMKKLEWCG